MKMSKVTIFLFLVAIFAAVSTEPTGDAEPVDTEELVQLYDGSVIMPRVTCDLLSGLGWAHTFCAAHCIFKGYKGGRCEKGVCRCRN
ncbi:defensin [Pectinophora gossypiella]|uniref:defensin n=1 Tax=Pectinophora gossypiella TaxID=13191 RepID=UPI00214F0A56|nr:defensin [Pectinophora gossypiella]